MRIAEEGWIKDEYRSRLRHMLLHSIRADETLKDLSVATKFNCDWNFLTQLRDRGREAASQWLKENFVHLGKRSTVDLHKEFLGFSSRRSADAFSDESGIDDLQERKWGERKVMGI